MKHLKISCQKHKIDSLLLSSRCIKKLHEKLFISTCSFLWINDSGWEFVQKKLMVKYSFIEKTYVVGNSNVYLQHMLLKTRSKIVWKFTFSKYHVHSLYLIYTSQTANLSFKIPFPLLQNVYICMTVISPNSSSWTVSLLICSLCGCNR